MAEPIAEPICTIGPSRPTEPPVPIEMAEDGWYRGDYEELGVCDVRARRVADALQRRAAEDTVLALVSHGTFIDRLLKALFRQTAPEFDIGAIFTLVAEQAQA